MASTFDTIIAGDPPNGGDTGQQFANKINTNFNSILVGDIPEHKYSTNEPVITYNQVMTGSQTLEKIIPIGSNKTHGRAIVSNKDNYIYGVMIEFSNIPMGTFTVGSGGINTTTGNATSRRRLGSVTSVDIGKYVANANGAIIIQEFYILGTNIYIKFMNTSSSNQTLGCIVDWEVW